MKRYVNIEIYELNYPTKEETSKHRVNPMSQNETVRILSAEEEKEYEDIKKELETIKALVGEKIPNIQTVTTTGKLPEEFDKKEFEGMKLDWTRFQVWKSHLAGFLLSRSKRLQPEKNYDLDIELVEYCKKLEKFDKKEFAWEWYKKEEQEDYKRLGLNWEKLEDNVMRVKFERLWKEQE